MPRAPPTAHPAHSPPDLSKAVARPPPDQEARSPGSRPSPANRTGATTASAQTHPSYLLSFPRQTSRGRTERSSGGQVRSYSDFAAASLGRAGGGRPSPAGVVTADRAQRAWGPGHRVAAAPLAYRAQLCGPRRAARVQLIGSRSLVSLAQRGWFLEVRAGQDPCARGDLSGVRAVKATNDSAGAGGGAWTARSASFLGGG